jgi:hypothetical protein
MRALCVWFAVSSPGDASVLSTGPLDKETHWRQTLVTFGREIALNEGDAVGMDITIEPAGGSGFGGNAGGNRQKSIIVKLYDPSKIQ